LIVKVLVLCSALAVSALPALAQEEQPAPAPKAAAPIGVPESGSPLGFLWAGAIVLACGGVAVFAKLKQKKLFNVDDEAIKVLGQKSLGGRAALMLINARGRDVLLSVNPSGASLLAEWPGTGDLEVKEPVEKRVEAKNDFAADFASDLVEEEAAAPPPSAAVSGLVRLRQQTQPRIAVPETYRQNGKAPAPTPRAPTNTNRAAPAAFPELFGREMRKVSR
jgi:flagellar biogenesis protein FliO